MRLKPAETPTLQPADIGIVSRLLDGGLALEPDQHEAWLALLPPEHQRHAALLREMLVEHQRLEFSRPFDALPKLGRDDASAHVDDRVGPYRLVREIGRGGMGSVWLAERADGAYKRQVALKLPRLAWGAGLAERMARERDIGALLEHPNIARLYDAGVDERGRPYLALQFVDGQPIDAWCEAQGLNTRDRLKLFVQVVKAVSYAHGRLVVHRDLKPSNVLVTSEGQAHLLDFGIAKLLLDAAADERGLTQEQGRVMTPHYASPEQVAGEAITVQSDVYSLGVLLYELLTGALPIAPKRQTLGAVEEAILQGDAPLASSRMKDSATARTLRGEVDAMLAKAMQRQPERRYATADALAQDIERYLAGETVSAQPDSLAYRLRKALRRHRVGAAAGSLVVLSMLVGGGLALRQSQRANSAAQREQVVKDFVADVLRASLAQPGNRDNGRGEVQRTVDDGVRLIQTRFQGQPALQADLLGVVGSVYSSMGAYAYAAEYKERRLTSLSKAGADRWAQAEAEMRLAEDLLRASKVEQAAPHAMHAVELAQGRPAAFVDALAMLARVQLWGGKPAEAAATLDRLEAALAGAAHDTLALAWLRAGRAMWQVTQGRIEGADGLLERGIDMATRVEGPLSLAAIDMRLALAREIGRRHRKDIRAQRHLNAALAALEQRGGADAVRAAYERAQLWWLMPGDPYPIYAVAVAELQKNQALIDAAALPVPALLRAEMDFFRGQVELEYGNLIEAELWLRAGQGLVLQANEAPAARFRAVGYLANQTQATGHHDESEALRVERMRLRALMGQGRHVYIAYDYVGRSSNLVMAGRLDDASGVLASAPHFEGAASGAAMPLALTSLRLARARLQLERGEFAAARATVADLSTDQPAIDGIATNVVLRAQLDCADPGRAAAGLAVLEKEAQDGARMLYAHAPYLAWLRSQAGLCALATGDKTTAMRHAGEARAAFVAQPGVSPYFKAPLARLEQALKLPQQTL